MSCQGDAKLICGVLSSVTGTPGLSTPSRSRLTDLDIDHLPKSVARVFQALRNGGFRAWHAGGAVRDKVMGHDAVKDYDIEVDFGGGPAALEAAIASMGVPYSRHGQFQVYQVVIDGQEMEIAMRRMEKKDGVGYTGFSAEYHSDITHEQACGRRDFTINSMLYDPFSGELIDPYNGTADIEARILRPTTEAFAEDPVRVLRACLKFAPRYGMTLTNEGVQMCRSLITDYAAYELLSRVGRNGRTLEEVLAPYGVQPRSGESDLSAIQRVIRKASKEEIDQIVSFPDAPDRLWKEWDGMRNTGRVPSYGLEMLKQTGWLRTVPELAALDNISQNPVYHPEGDALQHTAYCLDAAQAIAERDTLNPDEHRILFFAVLGHDLGKAKTTKIAEDGRIVSPGHDLVSVKAGQSLRRRLGVPKEYDRFIDPLIRHHMWHLQEQNDTAVQELAEALKPATIRQWARVVEADYSGRPRPEDPRDQWGRPLPVGERSPGASWLARAEALGCADGPPAYVLNGKDLIGLGMKPGRELGNLLGLVQAAQRQGEFTDRTGAIQWLRRHHKGNFVYLTGHDLIKKGIPSGPQIGHLLEDLFDAQIAGEVTSYEQAEKWLSQRVNLNLPHKN